MPDYLADGKARFAVLVTEEEAAVLHAILDNLAPFAAHIIDNAEGSAEQYLASKFGFLATAMTPELKAAADAAKAVVNAEVAKVEALAPPAAPAK